MKLLLKNPLFKLCMAEGRQNIVPGTLYMKLLGGPLCSSSFIVLFTPQCVELSFSLHYVRGLYLGLWHLKWKVCLPSGGFTVVG